LRSHRSIAPQGGTAARRSGAAPKCDGAERFGPAVAAPRRRLAAQHRDMIAEDRAIKDV
jgi:hypothetical protein